MFLLCYGIYTSLVSWFSHNAFFFFISGAKSKNNLTLSQWHILDSSKLKEFADDYFESDENVRKFTKRVENTVEKGEISRYEEFLLFPQCF